MDKTFRDFEILRGLPGGEVYEPKKTKININLGIGIGYKYVWFLDVMYHDP